MEARRRLTLYDQMSTVDSSRDSLAGLTPDAAAMASHKRATATSRRQFSSSRTLLDIIREDNSSKKDRKSWQVFRDKLRLKRAGSAWFSAIHVAATDISIPNQNNSDSRLNSNTLAPATSTRPETSRPDSFRRDGEVTTFRDCFDCSSDDDDDDSDPARERTRRLSSVISEERALSAREAEAAAAAAMAEEEPVRMSLMDLLEETDRQMGFEESRYRMGDDEGCENEKEREKKEEDEEVVEESKEGEISIEQNCCVCMVRRKGAAFIPCGHTFCRQCSRELWVSRGHCPLCNNFIVEILDLF